MAKLIFLNPEHAGQVYELTLEKTMVGRAAGNTLVIADRALSARHCEILVHGAEVIVRDLGSSNGTVVNGVLLKNRQSQLKSGQTLRFGSVEARLELDPPGSEKTDITAVYAMRRHLREEEKRRENPPPAPVSMSLGAADSKPSEDHTATLKVSAPTPVVAEHSVLVAVSGRERSAPGRASRKATAILAGALVVGLMIVLWLWWNWQPSPK